MVEDVILDIAMSYLAKKHNVSFNIFEAIMLQRQKYNHWLADLCLKHANKNPILILGKSFKPETNIITGSPSIYLYNSLKKKKHTRCFVWQSRANVVWLIFLPFFFSFCFVS